MQKIRKKIESGTETSLSIGFLDGSFLKKSVPWFSDDGVNEAIIAKREEDINLPRVGVIGWAFLDMQGEEPNYHDLFSTLFRWAEESGKKVLFIGQDKERIQKLLNFIKQNFPRLHTDALLRDSLYISGEGILEGREEEQLLLNHLEKEQPTILITLFQHPDLELWMKKMKKRLKVPVVILLDHKEEDLLYGKKPTWIQAHLCTKLSFLTIPLLLKEYFVKQQRESEPGKVEKYLSDEKELYVVRLPKRLAGKVREKLTDEISAIINTPLLLVDFTELKEFEAKGLYLLEALWKRQGLTFGFGMQKRVEMNLRHNRTLDLFLPHLFEKRDQLLRRLEEIDGVAPLYWGIEQKGEISSVNLIGPLDARMDQTNIYNQLIGKLREPVTQIDFSLCPFIDSSGLGLLLRLRKYHQQMNRQLLLTGLNSSIEQTFKIARVDTLFNFRK